MCVSSRTAGAPLHDAAPRPGMTSLLAGSHSPRPPHLAPPTPQPVARLCSSASQLLLRSLTSHVRSSSATAPRLPDAGQSSAPQLARRGISRFRSQELLYMPGSSTTPGRSDLAMVRPKRVAFPRSKQRRHPGIGFRGSMAGLCPPLPTLRRRPYGRQRTARGRCGSLHLHRGGLAPPTPCRSPGALRVSHAQPGSPVSISYHVNATHGAVSASASARAATAAAAVRPETTRRGTIARRGPEIRLEPWKSARSFKGIFCDDISEFESFSIGAGWCQALSDCSVDLVSMSFRRVLASLRDRHLGPPMMGSGGCGGPIYRGVLAVRLTAGIRTRNGLAPSIVPAGTSLHRSAEFTFLLFLLCTNRCEIHGRQNFAMTDRGPLVARA